MQPATPITSAEIEIDLMPGVRAIARVNRPSIAAALSELLPLLIKAGRLQPDARPTYVRPSYTARHEKTRPKAIKKDDQTPTEDHIYQVLTDADAISVMITFSDTSDHNATITAYRGTIY